MKYSRIPLNGIFEITCEFGEENPRYACGWHTGVDLINDEGIVYSPTFGIVNNIGFDASYGNFVDIVEEDGSHHWLCHLQSIYNNINIGTNVIPTTPIGLMGSTGKTTGKHLHYEIRNQSNRYKDVVDPCDYMGIPNERGTYNESDYSIYGEELKTLSRNTNLRNQPTTSSSEKTLYRENTTLFVIEEHVAENDGFVWDKVKIRVTGQEGYMINKNYKRK